MLNVELHIPHQSSELNEFLGGKHYVVAFFVIIGWPSEQKVKGDEELWRRLVGIKADFAIGFCYRQACFLDGSGELRVPFPLVDGDLVLFSMDLDADGHVSLPSCWIYPVQAVKSALHAL